MCSIPSRLLLPLTVFLFCSPTTFVFGWNHKCERIKIPVCQELGYDLTVMPNFVGHEDQIQAERGVRDFYL